MARIPTVNAIYKFDIEVSKVATVTEQGNFFC